MSIRESAKLTQRPSIIEVRPLQDGDRQLVPAMIAQAFVLPPHRFEQDKRVPAAECRVLTHDQAVVASLRFERVGQFFGGMPVPAAAISAVQVVPECRGRGFGKLLFREVIQELHQTDVALATLFPTNVGFYRGIGFEIAGAHTKYLVPLTAISRRRGSAEVVRCTTDDHPSIKACYRTVATQSVGLIDRPDSWWEHRIFGGNGDAPVYTYLVRNNGMVSGYMTYVHDPDPREIYYAFTLGCRDFVWHDAETACALLDLAAAHPVVGINLTWSGPAREPLSQFIAGQDIRIERSRRWMLRLVNLRAALSARTFAPDITTAVILDVRDPVVHSNSGPHRIIVSGGRAEVERTHSAATTSSVNTLAALYSGWLTAADAFRCGLLPGATVHDLRALDTIFAAPAAWTMETF